MRGFYAGGSAAALRRRGGPGTDPGETWLGSSQHPKTLQNAKYDRLILLRHGLLPAAEQAKVKAAVKPVLVDWAEQLDKRGATLEKVLVTHGHIDHCGAVAEVAERAGVRLVQAAAVMEATTQDPVAVVEVVCPLRLLRLLLQVVLQSLLRRYHTQSHSQ